MDEPKGETTSESTPDTRGLLEVLVGDGRPLLSLTGLSLVLSGAFALFLSATGHFLPHDKQFLGITAQQLCALHGCRVVHFMYHDRGAFGGAHPLVCSSGSGSFPLRSIYRQGTAGSAGMICTGWSNCSQNRAATLG